MAFHEVQFPTDISYGSEGGPGFSTDIIETDSGAEHRVSRWDQARRRYDVSYGVKTPTQASTLFKFYLARKGPLNGFRYRDFLDCTTSSTGTSPEMGGAQPTFQDHNIGTGDGNETVFQIVKRYTSGPTTEVRTIEKPNAGTVRAGVNGVEGTEGTDWTVDTVTGKITFSPAPPSGHAVEAGCQFDVPVRFGKEVDEALMLGIRSFDETGIGSIPLVEIIAVDEHNEDFFYGGSTTFTFAANIAISTQDGRVIELNPTAASLQVALPDKTTLVGGGPWFYMANVGANAVSIRDSNDDTEVISLATSAKAIIVLAVEGITRTWFAL